MTGSSAIVNGAVHDGGHPRRALVPIALLVPEREPVITSTREPRFVDHATCPMCGTDREGIEYHGVLMSGAKVYTLAAHTAGARRVASGQPRCLGAGMRMVFEGGVWKGAPAPAQEVLSL